MTSVKIPRFYINVMDWLYNVGGLTNLTNLNLTSLSPSHPIELGGLSPNGFFDGSNDEIFLPEVVTPLSTLIGKQGFVAHLGHNYASCWAKVQVDQGFPEFNSATLTEPIINADFLFNYIGPQYDGFSIYLADYTNQPPQLNPRLRFDSMDPNSNNAYQGFMPKAGSIILGRYYDMVNAPNLELEYSIEYEGLSEMTSHDGSSFSNMNWNKPPSWGPLPSWELSDTDQTAYTPPFVEPEIESMWFIWDGTYYEDGRKKWYVPWTVLDEWWNNYHPEIFWDNLQSERDQGLIGITIMESIVGASIGLHLEWITWPDGHQGWHNNSQYPFTLHAENLTPPYQGEQWDGPATRVLFHYTQESLAEQPYTIPGFYGANPSFKKLSRSGRRTFRLQFTHMDRSDLFGSNQSLGIPWQSDPFNYYGPPVPDPDNYDSGDLTSPIGSAGSQYFFNNLLTDDNWFSQVYSKTLGGSLKFIFSPDNTSKDPDSFVIARFKNNSLKVTRASINTYNISVIIEETF